MTFETGKIYTDKELLKGITMSNINIVIDMLRKQRDSFKGDYYIPELWNYAGYKDFKINRKRPGEINVNPYAFMVFCLERLLEENGGKKDRQLTGDLEISCSGDTLCGDVIYSMFPRMFTAWNHYDEKICPGTLLKSTILLPYLKQFGISIIYLLPVFKYSNIYKKGEMGSPYAIKDVYKLDEGFHDDLLGIYSQKTMELEFKAFVEACHKLGIKVMIDFVFRTVARDSDLIADHPDWFYWIGLECKDTFQVPGVLELENPTPVVNDTILEKLYKSEAARKCITAFKPSPDVKDSTKWRKVKKRYAHQGQNILDLIEQEFGITTVPGFSDVVNDAQPAWSDVTYLRYYFDVNDKADKYISEEQAPYILQDGVKLSYYPGKKINNELWDYISDVIPYYQTKFGIDGARIDMGHALPPELNKIIVSKAKKLNKNFILWSEEFNCKNSNKAKEDGFNFITSGLWGEYKNYREPDFPNKLYDILCSSELPVTGALENADTPRAALRYGKQILEHLVLINFFIPNAVPLINNGQELMEIQPMNLGLDNTEEGRYVLSKKDPMYGKLAFFDNYRMHWDNSESVYISEKLKKGYELRRQFIDLIKRKQLAICPIDRDWTGDILFIGYYDSETGKNVLLLANRNMEQKTDVDLAVFLHKDMRTGSKYIEIVYTNFVSVNRKCNINDVFKLEPGEIIIASIT